MESSSRCLVNLPSVVLRCRPGYRDALHESLGRLSHDPNRSSTCPGGATFGSSLNSRLSRPPPSGEGGPVHSRCRPPPPVMPLLESHRIDSHRDTETRRTDQKVHVRLVRGPFPPQGSARWDSVALKDVPLWLGERKQDPDHYLHRMSGRAPACYHGPHCLSSSAE